MPNKVQRRFKKAMNRVSRQEAKKKHRFYSFLENDLITGYYRKRKTDKWERMFVKALQWIMAVILLVLGFAMGTILTLSDDMSVSRLEIILSIFALMSFIVLCFGLIHPHTVFSRDSSKSRMKVLKVFGTITLALLFAVMIYNPQ